MEPNGALHIHGIGMRLRHARVGPAGSSVPLEPTCSDWHETTHHVRSICYWLIIHPDLDSRSDWASELGSNIL
jgi:hypothetical protein